MSAEDCIFCKIVSGEIPSLVLYDDTTSRVLLDAYPITPGHALVVMKQHVPHFEDLTPEQASHIATTALAWAPVIRNAMKAQGFNLGLNNGEAAGQLIPHVHLHIIPRYDDDGLRPWPNSKISAEKLNKVHETIMSYSKLNS